MSKLPSEKYLDSIRYEIAYASKILRGEIGADIDVEYALTRLKEADKLLNIMENLIKKGEV